MKICIETYGCTSNHADSNTMEFLLVQNGHDITSIWEADTIIVNTCTVTRKTEQRMIKRLKKLLELRKNVIVAGCLPAAQPEVIPGQVRVITPPAIRSICEVLGENGNKIGSRIANPKIRGVTGIVSISQGCVGSCSYCIVKRARGGLRSYPKNMIIEEIESLVSGGAREIQLTAQDTAAYGLDTGERLPSLLEEISSIPGDFQVRVGMMNPFTALDIVDDLVDAFDSPKIFKFLHLPLQSGSDKILKDMRREHKVEDYKTIVCAFREKYPDLTLSTDFIVGFPTETEEDFHETLRVLYETRPIKVNITRFSPRPYTPAASLPDVVERIKKERSRILTKAHHEVTREANKAWVGRILEVLVTEQALPRKILAGKKPTGMVSPGTVIARDSTYKNIAIPEELPLGSRLKVKITEARHTYLVGERTR